MTLTIAQIRIRLKYADALREAADGLPFLEQYGSSKKRVCVCGGAVPDYFGIDEIPHAEDCSRIQLIGQADFLEAAMIGATLVAER